MKKILSLVLAVAMLMSLCSFASAESEPVELTWWLFTDSSAPIDQAEVDEALNAYSIEKLGIKVNFVYMAADQINLAMSSGEAFDICFTCDWYNDFATNCANGMFLDITDLVGEYAPDLVASMPENVWAGSYFNGRLYAIPHMKDYGMEIMWILDTDYFINQKGLEENHYISFEGIEEYLAMYKADYPDDYPLKISKSGITSWMNCLVDWVNMEYLIGLDWEAQGTDEELVVKAALEVPAFVNRLKTIHSWYEKGYINQDAAVTESMGRAVAGVVQSGQGWFGAETVWSNARQKASYIARYDGPYMSTSSLRGSMTAISSATEHAKECLQIIQLMNTDATYRTLARYGIEGKHYIDNGDGTVTKTEYGTTNYKVQAYGQGFYNVGPIEASAFESVPADPDMWEKVFAGYENATLSAAMGFTFDPSNVDSQCLAISSIWNDYKAELITGTSDPDVVIPQILEEMNAAGLQDIIAEAQAQLNAYMGK